MEDSEIRQNVREGYGKIARESGQCCGPGNENKCCCNTATPRNASRNIGYSNEEMDSVPDGANLGLGCGNPLALASIKEGDTVMDLGSGAGFDSFLAANRVGPTGRVIGVDMTPDMLEKARENARKGNYSNVEFRLGEIEALPAADNTIDLITSNCVINLSVDKKRVFKEAFRVLKPGGKLMVSDIVLTKELPETVRKSVSAYVGCIGGALLEQEYLGAIEAAGFSEVRIADIIASSGEAAKGDPTASALTESTDFTNEEIRELAKTVLSIKVSAVKPT